MEMRLLQVGIMAPFHMPKGMNKLLLNNVMENRLQDKSAGKKMINVTFKMSNYLICNIKFVIWKEPIDCIMYMQYNL